MSGAGAVVLNKIYLLSFSLLFLAIQPSFADMNAANDALARGDHTAAAAEFQKLAEQGDKKAQAHLGYMYNVGEGVEQDYAKAVKWYKKAAILGDKDSQYNLAVAYAFGEGVKQDYKEAFHWYRRAAEQNHAVSQYSLGVSYAYGEGIAQNPELAAEWFQKSAEQGYERAQVLLGSLYHIGDGVEKDYEKAAYWYRKAADKGNAAAQYNLGNLYRAGNGVAQDYNQAVRWFRLSADQGYAAAQNELSSIERAMAGANRPAPVSVPEIEETPVQTKEAMAEDVEKSAKSIPTLAKTEPAVTETIPSDSAATTIDETPTTKSVEEAEVADASVEDEPKQGFFSRLFGKKDTVNSDSTPDQSGVVYATPEEIAAAENSVIPDPNTEIETPEEIVSPEPEITEPVIAETEEVPEPEVSESPATDVGEAVTEVEGEPKRGFFSRLFGKKDSVDSTPDQSGVVYATPEEIAAAENSVIPDPNTEIETPEEIVSSEPEITEPVIAEIEEVPEPEVSESTDIVDVEDIQLTESQLEEPDDTRSQEIIDDNDTVEAPKKGFFARLFGKKDTTEVQEVQHEEDLQLPEVVEKSIDTSSQVITYAADSAPAGQQLDTSLETEPTEDLSEPDITATQLPAEIPPEDIALTEPDSFDEVKTETSVEEISEKDAPKKGFFSRLFGSKDTDNTEENAVAAEVVEIDASEDPIVIAKLEEPDLSDSIQRETEEEFIDSIEVAPDVENISNASEIQPLAIRGDSDAQFQLGALFYQGKGVQRDYTQAFLWYRRAAQQGNADAQYSLGNMYLMGEGIKQDDYQARQWYEKASEQGHEGAQHNLASLQRIATAEPAAKPEYDPETNNLAENEEALEEEPEEKRGFFSKLFGKDDAVEEELDDPDVSTEDVDEFETSSGQMSVDSSEATENSPSSIYEKGLAFEFGEGVPQSYSTAFEFFKKSADQNHAPAQYKVGLAYDYGQGAEKDPAAAAEWYKKSAAQGYALAQRTLATLYMSGEDIEQNKPLALAWYEILADGGNVMDVHRRDALKDKLTSDEIDEAQKIKQDLSN